MPALRLKPLRQTGSSLIVTPDLRSAHHTEDDTLFLEIALQRAMRDLAATLLPLTGTPTAIWRRTGEILAVGAEFCILTEWSQQDLIFRDTEDVPLAERGATAGGGNMKDGFEGWKGCFCWEVMEKQRCAPPQLPSTEARTLISSWTLRHSTQCH